MNSNSADPNGARILNAAVIVSALGYFVDIYDLILFSVVRIASLKSLGVPAEELMDQGVLLLNSQMIGMLVGGLLWGILGDKRGRLTVLFGSIILYSLANLANAAVTTVEQYAWLRFIAGVGLAGELGAGITLVSEILPKERRGVGTTLVAGVGVLGALLAAKVAEIFDWRTAYVIGGVLGLALLVLRVSVFESKMFEKIRTAKIERGHFTHLFKDWDRFYRYMRCILIGVPIWFTIGILITFSPEFAVALQVQGEVTAGKAVMFSYLGLSIGDFVSGLLSQILKSRKRVLYLFLALTFILVIVFLFTTGLSVDQFYLLCALLGFGCGYWAIFVSVGAEQFGTNLRSTVTTTVPNFVRGSVVPLTASMLALKGPFGIVTASFIVGCVALAIAAWAAWKMEESFGRDLNFLE